MEATQRLLSRLSASRLRNALRRAEGTNLRNRRNIYIHGSPTSTCVSTVLVRVQTVLFGGEHTCVSRLKLRHRAESKESVSHKRVYPKSSVNGGQ